MAHQHDLPQLSEDSTEKSLTVLIIEDNQGLNRLIQKRLEREGFHTKQVFDGTTAIAMIAEQPDRLILLDYLLPDMTAEQLIETLQEQHAPVPFIIMTGQGDEQVAVRMMKLGARDYVLKRDNFADILPHVVQRVQRELAGERRVAIAEAARQASERQFRTLIEHNADSIILLDDDGTIQFVNPAAETLFGRCREELIGTPFGFPLTRYTADELQIHRPDGTMAVAEIRSEQIEWQGKQAYLASVRDLTERRAIEEQVLQLRKAIETMHLGVTITDLERNILYTNPADAAMHGYTVDELLACDVRTFAPPDLRNPVAFEEIDSTQSWVRESVNMRKDGSRFPVQLCSDVVRDVDGSAIALVTTCEDITERKQAQAALQQAHDELELRVRERTAELERARERAESANHAKSEFLANMSHDLRTPLNAILGYAQILQEAEDISERHQKALKTIYHSGRQLLALIQDILELTKIEAGHLTIQHAELHCPGFLTTICEMVRLKAQQKGLSFEYDIDPALPIGIMADERQLRKVLMNLLGNAVKFTEQGRVTFRVGRTEKDCDTREPKIAHCPQPTAYLLFEVEDTGSGIEPDKLGEIFAPFQQNREQHYHIENTGLGLALSHKLVELMGGYLRVESAVGTGSRFWFVIPAQVISGDVPKPETLDRPGIPEAVYGAVPDRTRIDEHVLCRIPVKERQQLLQHAHRGNVKALLGQLEQIEQRKPQLLQALAILRAFAEEFQIDRLVDLLENLPVEE